MKIVWSTWALRQLDEIHVWYSTEASRAVADQMIDDILTMTRLLEQFPFAGQIEPLLQHRKMGHQRIVVGNYKVVYRVHEKEVRIMDVFDSRQDPGKMTV